MFKKRYFSAHSDFKTGIYFKLSMLVGVVLLIIYGIFKIIALLIENGVFDSPDLYYFIQSYADIFLSISIIILIIGFISYFFYIQFTNLSKISEEIEYIQELEKEIEKIKQENKEIRQSIAKLEKKK